MDRMVRVLVVSAAWLLLAAAPAWAQGTATSALSASSPSRQRGVVPGATVVVKNNATGVSFKRVTNSTGAVFVSGADAGTYTVTVSLSGFKTFVASDVASARGRPGEVNAKLEVGSLTETVEVKAGTELVQTQSTAVSSTSRSSSSSSCRSSRATRSTSWRSCPAWRRPAARAAPSSTACRTTPSTSRSTASAPATSCSRPTASSRW